jgi:hypothetical protein
VLLGLAVSAAPQLAVLGVAALLLAARPADEQDGARPAGRLPDALVGAGTAVLVWAGLRVVLFSGLGGGVREAWEGWRASGPGYGSIWLVPQLLVQSKPRGSVQWWFGTSLGPGLTTTLSLLALLAVLAAGFWVARSARRPQPAPVALMLLVGVLLANTSLPVQASLLLLPLIAAAGLGWRDHLIWAVAELAYFVGVWLYIAGQSADRGLPANFYLVLLLARLGALAWIGVQAARTALGGADLWTGFTHRRDVPVPSPGQTH